MPRIRVPGRVSRACFAAGAAGAGKRAAPSLPNRRPGNGRKLMRGVITVRRRGGLPVHVYGALIMNE